MPALLPTTSRLPEPVGIEMRIRQLGIERWLPKVVGIFDHAVGEM
jgi:hypothetical protein